MKVWLIAHELSKLAELTARLAGTGWQVTAFLPSEADSIEQLVDGSRLIRSGGRSAAWAAKPTGQTEDHPGFPFNVLDARLARSYELGMAAEALAAAQGPPDLLIVDQTDALPYFLLQRRMTVGGPLEKVPLMLFTGAEQATPGEPHYKLPGYWVRRLTHFCALAADRVLAPELWSDPASFASACSQAVQGFKSHAAFPANTPEAQGAALARDPGEQPNLLSVVVPFYNLGKYIGETIDSIVASTYRPLEIIVLDDGSDQAGQAALARAAGRHPQLVRVVRTENSGLARARNAGAEAARGEFLAFVDADDLIEPAFCARAIRVLKRYQNVSMVYSWVRLFGAVEACVPTWNTELPFLLGRNMLVALLVLRRADFLAYGRNDPTIAGAFEDHEAWIRMVAHGCVGVSIPEPLVRYRVREDSMLRAASDQHQLALLELIAERHQALYQRYGGELFALQNANGPALYWNQPGAETIDYRSRYAELLAAYERQQRMLGPLRPLAGLVRRLRGRG